MAQSILNRSGYSDVSLCTNSLQVLAKREFEILNTELEGRGISYTQEWPSNGKSYLVRTQTVFQQKTLDAALKWLPNDKYMANSIPNTEDVFYKNCLGLCCSFDEVGTLNSSLDVEFGIDGQIKNMKSLEANFNENNLNVKLQNLTLEGINCFSSSLNWKETKVPMMATILDYRLMTEEACLKDFQWHFDRNSMTMISVLNTGSGFSGGDFEFSTQNRPFSTHSSHINYPVLSNVQKFSHEPNTAFIFDNVYSVHRVSDIIGCGHRYLFSIFANPSPEQFEHAVANCTYPNLYQKS